MGEGREGDWECAGCRNRNYAFRSLCNRCKQPRLLVDRNTPADSKWLPRVGDWICTGCSNNNYASREICKKCGQSKEEAAMPAIAMSGALMPTYAHHFARVQGLLELKMNYGITGNCPLQQPLPPNSNWSFGGAEKYGLQSWPLSGGSSNGLSYPGNTIQPPGVPKGWRNGDWICSCGFHNYSSRSECKKCSASGIPSSGAISTVPDLFPTLGTKRLASDEFVNDWDNKRLNAGDVGGQYMHKTPEQHPYLVSEQFAGSSYDHACGLYSKYSGGNLSSAPPAQGIIQPNHLGKGFTKFHTYEEAYLIRFVPETMEPTAEVQLTNSPKPKSLNSLRDGRNKQVTSPEIEFAIDGSHECERAHRELLRVVVGDRREPQKLDTSTNALSLRSSHVTAAVNKKAVNRSCRSLRRGLQYDHMRVGVEQENNGCRVSCFRASRVVHAIKCIYG